MSEQHFLQPRSHRFYNFAIVIAGLLAFVFVPLFILSPEQAKLHFNNGRETQVLSDALFLTAIFCAVLAAYYWLLTLLRLKAIAATHVMFVLSWVALSGFLFPLTTSSDMLELRHAPVNMVNLTAVIVLSVILAIAFVSRYSKIAQVFMIIFIAVAIVPVLPKAVSQFETRQDLNESIQFSSTKNLVLVGFDGIPRHIAGDILASSPEFAETFSDFIFYQNVVSSAPATQGSVTGIVYGDHDYTPQSNDTWNKPEKLYFNQKDRINHTSAFHFNAFNIDGVKLTAGQYGKSEQREELFDVYRYVTSRITSKFGVNIVDVISRMHFGIRDGRFFFTVSGFEKVLSSFEVTSDKPSSFYGHFAFTHWPIVVDENCEDTSPDREWVETHQNVKGLRAAARCGFLKYTDLISRLKRLGIYENTTIILLSDHGMVWRYYETDPHYLKVNNGRALGYDTYLPFLMIKPAGRSANVITMSEKYVVLSDLAQTTCNVFETADFCEQYPGLNILDDNDIAPDEFYIHVVKDENSSWSAIDHKAVKLPRGIPLLDAMKASPEIALTEPEFDTE